MSDFEIVVIGAGEFECILIPSETNNFIHRAEWIGFCEILLGYPPANQNRHSRRR